ncbi:hypothetical protein [Paenibacillus wulumuqiensis]|uniref:hypothetical protein n=1 Tax=Paenibacillus wulumuqiensis TaxID=1567107 RepID=UPI0006190559|nr:hypothetical protein [Paenibacillus wulumuqiensis]
MKSTFVLKGLIFGMLLAVIIAFLFMLVGQITAGGITSLWGESWLYFSVIIPFAVVFMLLGGYFYNRNEVSNKKLWLLSLIVAFAVTLYSGTIGAIFGEYIARGESETINVEGTLTWGTIYAFVLLPVTVPFARLLIGIFYNFVFSGHGKKSSP